MSKDFDTAVAGDRLIKAVRSALDAMGRPDIALEREWLTVTAGDGDHIEAILMVPIGRNLSLPLKSVSRYEDPQTVIARFANEVFQALQNVERARWGLCRYAADTRRAAETAIANLRTEGLDITLAGIGLLPTYAWHMTHDSWKEAADHALATVLVNGLDFRLNPKVIEFAIQDPQDVADAMTDALDRQIEFQDMRDALRGQGATVAVDDVTLRVLFEHDLGYGTICEVVRDGHKNVELTMRDGSSGNLFMVSSEGKVTCSYYSRADRTWRWCGDRLELRANPAWGADETLVGRDVAELAGDELFKGLTVASVRRATSDVLELAVDVPTRLFNADTGQFLRKAA